MTFLSNETSIDFSKMLNEWALAAGRHLQSKQTSYLHYYPGDDQAAAQTIPLLENVLFALSLLRSRLIEQIQEAKQILKGVLSFQDLQDSEQMGNFPIYLHEYPVCHDYTLALQLLAPFNFILKQFGHVIGIELKQQIEKSARLALEYSLHVHQIKPFSYPFAIRLAAAQYAYGLLWENSKNTQEGMQKLNELSQQQLEGWTTTKQLGDILIGLQMVHPSLKNTHWQPLWERMEQTWHTSTGCYVGPCTREWQEKEEPKTTAYDLYASYFAGQFSKRVSASQIIHLHGVLIQPSSDKFNSPHCLLKSQFKQQTWMIKKEAKEACTVLEKKGTNNPSTDKTHTPFRLVWGDLERSHSFVCQGDGYHALRYLVEDQKVQLLFDLKEGIEEDNRGQHRVIEFFADLQPGLSFTVNQQSTNTFELGEEILFSWHQKPYFSLKIDLIEGKGMFLGHVMRGNRPSQLDLKGDKRFNAYDWTFFLRAIRWEGPCTLKATLAFQDPKN